MNSFNTLVSNRELQLKLNMRGVFMDNLKELLRAINAVKATPRTGWMLRGVPATIAESIAEHMYEASIYGILLVEKLRNQGINVNLEHVLLMTIIHDFPEAYVGDIVKAVKERIPGTKEIEVEVMDSILKMPLFVNILKEYNRRETLEAKIAKLAETLATYVQAKRYVKIGFENAREIVNNAVNEIDNLIKEKPLNLLKEVIKKIMF